MKGTGMASGRRPPVELYQLAIEAMAINGTKTAAARQLGWSRGKLDRVLSHGREAAASARTVTPLVVPRGSRPYRRDGDTLLRRTGDLLTDLERGHSKALEIARRLEAELDATDRKQVPRMAEVLLKALGEARGYVDTSLRAYETIHSAQRVQAWQDIVIGVIDECAPDVAATIRRRLRDAALTRTSVSG